MHKLLEMININKNIKIDNEITPLIKDLTFDINCGEALAVIGTSETHMSALLYLISGIYNGYEGTVKFHPSLEIDKIHKICYTCNKNYFFEWRTVYDNICLFYKINMSGVQSDDDIEKYIYKTLDKFNLLQYKDKYPSQLSGSIKNKITLIENIMLDPKLLVIDNAFSNIDFKTKAELLHILRKSFLNEEHSILFATGNIDDILILADRVIILSEPPVTVKKIVDVRSLGCDRTSENIKENPAYTKFSNCFINELYNE